ncbi:hypothetical protein K1T71_001100, partial [Dendrolimus kikuchii]
TDKPMHCEHQYIVLILCSSVTHIIHVRMFEFFNGHNEFLWKQCIFSLPFFITAH